MLGDHRKHNTNFDHLDVLFTRYLVAYLAGHLTGLIEFHLVGHLHPGVNSLRKSENYSGAVFSDT